MLRSQVASLQTDLFSAGASFTTVRSTANTATLALNLMRCDNQQLKSQVSELLTLDYNIRLLLALAQSSISPAVFESFHNERD